jgi:gephyrin
MGDRDLIKPLLARDGSVHFGRVCMKPGKPLTFATLHAPSGEGGGEADAASAEGGDGDNKGGGGRPVLVFGLPGNPVSSFVCFHLVVLPALRRMAGWAEPRLRRVRAFTTAPLKLDPERPEYHRATVAYGPPPSAIADKVSSPNGCVWYAVSTGNQISSRLLSARSANALLELPRAAGVVPAGTEVSALLIGDVRAMPSEANVPLTEGFE